MPKSARVCHQAIFPGIENTIAVSTAPETEGVRCRSANPAAGPGRIIAVDYVRRMPGGSQSQLLRCSDGEYYVVKFQNNPQGKRILANDLLGSILARKMGLPVGDPAVVEVPQSLINRYEDMCIQCSRGRIPLQPGLCFGSRLPMDSRHLEKVAVRQVLDVRARADSSWIENVLDVPGMLVFDKWTYNTDDRQAIFVRDQGCTTYRAVMIDQGHCFNGVHWNFPDYPIQCLGLYELVYSSVKRFGNFEPWIERLETEFDIAVLEDAGNRIPPEWYDGYRELLLGLLERLDRRRADVVDLLWCTWKTIRRSFSVSSLVMRLRPRPPISVPGLAQSGRLRASNE